MGVDQALIALFIGAMLANGHESREELARAQHLIWSTRRFRRASGDRLNRLIDDTRTMVDEGDPAHVLEAAARSIPPRLKKPAFIVVTDLLLVDGKLDAAERRFLQRLAEELSLDGTEARQLVDVIRMKNQL